MKLKEQTKIRDRNKIQLRRRRRRHYSRTTDTLLIKGYGGRVTPVIVLTVCAVPVDQIGRLFGLLLSRHKTRHGGLAACRMSWVPAGTLRRTYCHDGSRRRRPGLQLKVGRMIDSQHSAEPLR